jgi:hypothetical protein
MKIFAWYCTICLTAAVAFADLSKDEITRLRESAFSLSTTAGAEAVRYADDSRLSWSCCGFGRQIPNLFIL